MRQNSLPPKVISSKRSNVGWDRRCLWLSCYHLEFQHLSPSTLLVLFLPDHIVSMATVQNQPVTRRLATAQLNSEYITGCQSFELEISTQHVLMSLGRRCSSCLLTVSLLRLCVQINPMLSSSHGLLCTVNYFVCFL